MFRRSIGLRISLLAFACAFSACTFSRILYHNFSTIDDWKIFSARPLPASENPWKIPGLEGKQTAIPAGVYGKYRSLEELLEKNHTTAFLVLKDGSLVYEKYFNGTARETISLGFSMSKSFFSLLLGKAFEAGIMGNTNDAVSQYIPELASRGYDRVTLEHLLNMASGSNYSDSDNPLTGDAPWYYYDTELERRTLTQKITGKPGAAFDYKSADTQLLGIALKRSLKGRTITDYFRETIWNQIGAEFPGQWSVDNNDGIEKVYCCLAATARDFIKLAALSLEGRNWQGRQIMPAPWLTRSFDPTQRFPAGVLSYRYQWWFTANLPHAHLAIGHLGQYALIYPEKRMVVLRLGRSEGNLNRDEWIRLVAVLAESRQ